MRAHGLRTGFLLAALTLVPPAAAADRERLLEISQAVEAETIRRHTIVLGGDALEGRAPGSRGGELAAAYIAAALKGFGVEPLGDAGGFLQEVPLVGSLPLPSSRLTLTGLGERRHLRLGEDYLLHTTGPQTWLPRPAPMVFVGYGIVAPEFDYNDYGDVDVRGKVAVFFAGEPSSEDPEFFAGAELTTYAAIETKMRIALARGAVASVVVPTPEALPGWPDLQRAYAFERIELAYSVPEHLGVLLRPDLAERLFADALYDYESIRSMQRRQTLRAFHLPLALAFEGEFRVRSFLAANVVGRIAGSGRRAADDAVVVSAHYDHLGTWPELDGDRIFNGVIDNAIGCAGLLEVARVLAALEERPRRSVILLFTTAEEEGNLGARYFLDHPPIPLPRMVANINIDGLAFLDRFEDVMGIGAELSSLGPTLQKTARHLGLEVSRPQELALGQEAFVRSEQVVFAEAGIPSLLVSEGLKWRSTPREQAFATLRAWMTERYHTPRDDLAQPIDFDAASEHARLILVLVLAIADNPLAPEWRPGVPYAYQRLLSLSDEAAGTALPNKP